MAHGNQQRRERKRSRRQRRRERRPAHIVNQDRQLNRALQNLLADGTVQLEAGRYSLTDFGVRVTTLQMQADASGPVSELSADAELLSVIEVYLQLTTLTLQHGLYAFPKNENPSSDRLREAMLQLMVEGKFIADSKDIERIDRLLDARYPEGLTAQEFKAPGV